jgi:hypothetical protein
VINDKGKGKQRETGEPSSSVDELIARTIAMGLEEDEEDQEYYGAGLENPVGAATSPTLLPPDFDPIDHNGVGVHAIGVTANPVVVEDSLWGDPLENINKKKRKEDEVPLCDYHGKICSKGICKVYDKQLREYQKKQKEKEKDKEKDKQEPRNWRDGGRGGARGRTRGGGMPLRGPERKFEPRPSTDGDLHYPYFPPVSRLIDVPCRKSSSEKA